MATSASDAGDPSGPRVRRTDAWNAARARRHALSQSSGPYAWRRRASPPPTAAHADRSRPKSSSIFFASSSRGDPSSRGASSAPTNVRSVDQSDFVLLPLAGAAAGVVGVAGDAGGGGGGGVASAASSSSSSSL